MTLIYLYIYTTSIYTTSIYTTLKAISMRHNFIVHKNNNVYPSSNLIWCKRNGRRRSNGFFAMCVVCVCSRQLRSIKIATMLLACYLRWMPSLPSRQWHVVSMLRFGPCTVRAKWSWAAPHTHTHALHAITASNQYISVRARIMYNHRYMYYIHIYMAWKSKRRSHNHLK